MNHQHTTAPRRSAPTRESSFDEFAGSGRHPPRPTSPRSASRQVTVVTPSAQPPRFCAICQAARAAWTNPRVDVCYGCLPGGPFAPPPCLACGSLDYFCQGLCVRCHQGSPKRFRSCRGCLAWGVLRVHNWLCWGCRDWRRIYPTGTCRYCRSETRIGRLGACRLCYMQAVHAKDPGGSLDLDGANRYGQQLFLANLHQDRGPRSPRLPQPAESPPRRHRGSRDGAANRSAFGARPYVQSPLFHFQRDLSALRLPAYRSNTVDAVSNTDLEHLGAIGDPDACAAREGSTAQAQVTLRHVDAVLTDHAAQHGWPRSTINRVRRGLRILLALQPIAGAPISAAELQVLGGTGLPTEPAKAVLAAAGLWADDAEPPIHRYFRDSTIDLPDAIRAQLAVWFTVMTQGSHRPPRRRPRAHTTTRNCLREALPAIRLWVSQGRPSLSAVTRADADAALPPSGTDRIQMLTGLKSIFTILDEQRVIFRNPVKGIPTNHIGTIPTELDPVVVREALTAPNPAIALAVALVVFHALTLTELCQLQLTDIRDGRLTLPGRTIPLARPVRDRLRTWLDHRQQTWPNTTNPHLLIHRKTHGNRGPVTGGYLSTRFGVSPQVLREDRILNEIHATGGDARRISDLFGLSISGSARYTAALEHPEFRESAPHAGVDA